MLTWPSKDPNEVLDYEADWSLRLETTETIATSVFSIVTGTVVINSQPSAVGATAAVVWLSGGAAGELCTILNRVTTSAARTYDQTFRLRIRTR